MAEKPLTGFARFFLVVSAALAIALFYSFIVAVVILLLVMLACELAVAAACARFGAAGLITPYIKRHSGVLFLCLRSLWIDKSVKFQVPLTESDAPELFAFLRTLSLKFAVPAPREVLMEMNTGAWVMLKGVRRGADATTLGLGYDLVAGLTEREIEAVLAHEMAHAKLVRRGLKQWLGGGIARAIKLTNALSTLVNAYRHKRQEFTVGETLLRGADACTRLAVRLVAGYSRQDEFDADRGAALLCGSAPLRSALLKLDAMAAKTARISWSERLAQLQRCGGFSTWLAEELAVTATTPADKAPAGETDRYSTHPSTRDRFAAMPPDTSSLATSRPAISLFADPDAIARKLVAEIQRVAALEEKKDDRSQRQWLRKTQRGGSLRPLQWLAILGMLIPLVMAFASLASFSSLWPLLLVALAVVAGCVWLYRFGRYRDRRALPLPDYEAIRAADDDRTEEPKAFEARENELEANLKARLQGLARKPARELCIRESYEALAQCDYLRAHVVARHGVQRDDKCVETLLALAIAAAGLRQSTQAGQMLHFVQKQTGFRTLASLRGGGWALLLLGDYAGADAMLTASLSHTPDEPTLHALLAVCQSARNKHFSALAHARIALAAAPQSLPRILLVANLLIGSGRVRDAEQLLATAGHTADPHHRLALARIRVHLLQKNFAEADRGIEALQAGEITPDTMIELAQACETARCDEQAARFFAAALERGHYPEAHAGLAQLALHRRDFPAVKTTALAALDTSRPLGEKSAHPLSVLSQSLSHLLATEESITEARAWVATVTGNAVAGSVANFSFLVYAKARPHAEAHVKTVIDAFQPDKPTLMPNYVLWTDARPDQQPVGAVRPGIQRYWRN